MKISNSGFDGLYVIEGDRIFDDRGWFMRIYGIEELQNEIPNIPLLWKQVNQVYNKKKYTWRGLHCQRPPYSEAKLVRCIKGKVVDYVVDLRRTSDRFLEVFEIELSAENGKTLYIPSGFAHGYLTLESNTEMIYLHDNIHVPDHELGLRFNDPKLNLNLAHCPKLISKRDLEHSFITNDFKGF